MFQDALVEQHKEERIMFLDAEAAWLWSVEVLRMRRFARISSIYDQVVREEGPWQEPGQGIKEKVWLGEPLAAADKVAMAAKLARLVEGLGEERAQLLKLFAWGDYADEGRLRRALTYQTRMRGEGVRVRLSYRYSYRQLGLLLGVDHKTAAKRVREALLMLAVAMERDGLLFVPETCEILHEDNRLFG
jgi:hypothetical protein